MQPDRSTRWPAVLTYSCIAFLFLAISFTWGRSRALGDGMFWDGRVYTRAIAAARAGADPYRTNADALPFVSPPIFLKAAVPLSTLFPARSGWFIYLAVMMVSTLALPFIVARFYLQSDWMTPALAMALFTIQPRFTVEQTFNSGNIANPLYALVLLSGIPGLRANRWGWFYLAVFIAALIKPAMLSLLLLPVMAGQRQLGPSALTVVAAFLAYGLQRLTMPSLYAAFRGAVYHQLVVKHDIGIGLYSIFDRLGEKVSLLRGAGRDSIAHFAVVGLLIAFLFFRRKATRTSATGPLSVPALLVSAILANPRMQSYDTDIAILPALFLCVEGFRLVSRFRLGRAASAIAISLALLLFTTDYSVGICILFLTAAVLPSALARIEQTRASVPDEAPSQPRSQLPV